MKIPIIETPESNPIAIKRLSDFLDQSREWHDEYSTDNGGMLSDLWYRGVNSHFAHQVPGVYRNSFTERAGQSPDKVSNNKERKRLRLECEMLSQFRTAGAIFLEKYGKVQIYFAAQHFGMPTRLLDWSTNPLAALFFACDGESDSDGFVYAMDAKKIIPPDAEKKPHDKLYQAVMTMRHPFVEYAVGLSFWEPIDPAAKAFVLPVRPDSIPGRIGQQSSCFTLHMHGARPANNPTLITMKIDKKSKASIKRELHRLNINQFTTYYDLDHLSKEIKQKWGI